MRVGRRVKRLSLTTNGASQLMCLDTLGFTDSPGSFIVDHVTLVLQEALENVEHGSVKAVKQRKKKERKEKTVSTQGGRTSDAI